MMYSNDPDILTSILNYLESKDISVSKIVLQKLLFFMQGFRFNISYSFEPYKYGPFSEELSEDINMLKVDKKIDITDNNLKLCSHDTKLLKNESKEFIDMFDKIIEYDYNFGNIELYGTVFYCIRSLEESSDIVNEETVLQQFKGWKGNKFPENQVLKALSKVLKFKGSWNEKYNKQYFDILN